jgi:uncharacterized protein YdaU (DUF1376 family)
MPLYVAEYRKDTGHLSTAEHGAYMLLIMHYWATGGLPDNDGQLARITGWTLAEWRRSRATLQAFFHDGWKHKRVDHELGKAARIAVSNADKARNAANQRWSKDSNGDAPSMPQACSGDAPVCLNPQSPSQVQKEERENGSFKRVGEVRANGPRHGAISPSRGTVFIRKGTDDWITYVEDYRRAFGVEPEPNQHGGFWFKIVGVEPIPLPKRLTS